MSIVRDAEPDDRYPDKLGKILPAELTATYFLLRTFAGNSPKLVPYLMALALLLCLAFYWVSPKLLSMESQKNRILYCVTFILWVIAIDPDRIAKDFLFLSSAQIAVFIFLASGIAAIWSFMAPFLMGERSAG